MNFFKIFRGPLDDWRFTCDASLQTMKDLVRRKNLLNQKQCEDLFRKLTIISENIHVIVQQYNIFHRYQFYIRGRPATSDYYRCLEKAKMLVTNCGEKEWYRAATLQWRNVNAFEEILLDASLCYNVIYERGKFYFKETTLPKDLRQSSVFEPTSDNAVREDEEHLITRLQQFIKDRGAIEGEHPSCPEEVARARALARFLTIRFGADRSVVNDKQKNTSIGIMWDDHMEPPGTWGERCDLKGTGSDLVKAISTEWLGIPCFRKEFLGDEDENVVFKEASIMAHMKHPNIIRFLCHGNSQNPKCRFIGMELMEMSLSKLIEEQRGEYFLMEVTIDLIMQMGRGMCYLHDQQVAHRDLKPQNVVIKKWPSTPDFEGFWDVKLVDFGNSKTEVDDTKSNTMTYLGIGTPKYWAPELQPSSKYYSKNKVNWLKADVYSFAMTCVHVLSLKPPFSDADVKMTSYDLYRDILNGTSRPRLPRNCPQMLRKLLEDCWHILPCERPDFVQICSRLAQIRDETQGWETSDGAIDFIHRRIVSQSHRFKRISKVKATVEDARIITCTFNHKLVRLEKRPSEYIGNLTCDICYPSRIGGAVYNCSTCKFDAHRDCAEIREEICVFFHGHPLQLLLQNVYKDDPKAICSLCEGSIQNSEWVYRCEQCEYDVHSLCTKFPNHKRVIYHSEHVLTMRSCPPQMSLLCGRCNGEIQERAWHYYCKACAFPMHVTCISRPIDPLCSFDNSPSKSHRCELKFVPRIFHCALCDEQGYSQFYYCEHCDVDMHPDCVDYINEEAFNWNGTYEKLLMEKESEDVQAQTILISQILERMSSYCASQPKLSTHKSPSVVKNVKTPSYNPTTLNESHESLDSYNDVKHQRKMISAQTAERIKAKKLALNILRENPLEILENLEKIVSNLQSTPNASEDDKEKLLAVYKQLKKRQQLVKDEQATQEESRLCPGPRIGVFFKDVKKDGKYWRRRLLIDLQAGMKDVCFGLLCEKPRHEHIIAGKTKVYNKLEQEVAENLKPLLACGLEIVRNNITSTEHDLVGLESISIPNLQADKLWDLSAIDRIKGMEDIGVLKQAAVSASQWFLKTIELYGNIKNEHGLHRIRYIVPQEGNPPCYKNGSIAWLCMEHFDDGLKEGILESFSSKYHNIEDDYDIRYPPYLLKG